MGDEGLKPGGTPEYGKKLLEQLEEYIRKLDAENEARTKQIARLEELLQSERARSFQLEDHLSHMRKRLEHRIELFRFLDESGKRIGADVKRAPCLSETVRTAELGVISRYVDITRDVQLVEKFQGANRPLLWFTNLFDTQMYVLDKVFAGLGQQLYGGLVYNRDALSVIDLEATVRYAASFAEKYLKSAGAEKAAAVKGSAEPVIPLPPELEGLKAGLPAINGDYLDRARTAYREELKAHGAYYDSLDVREKTMLKLRNVESQGSWDKMLANLDKIQDLMAGAEMSTVNILDFGETRVEQFRSGIDKLRGYEQEHHLDLSWFSQLPADIVAFIKG